jgi:hypothetical protein
MRCRNTAAEAVFQHPYLLVDIANEQFRLRTDVCGVLPRLPRLHYDNEQ